MNKTILLDNKGASSFQLNAFLALSEYRVLALLASTLCFLSIVDASIQQFQMYLLGGRIIFGASLIKIVLLGVVMLGCVSHPKIKISAIPLLTWLLCIVYLIFEVVYLNLTCGLSVSDILASYNSYYLLLLIGPAIVIFRGTVSQRTLIRCSVLIFAVCAMVGAAQYLTASPILYTESLDGSFSIPSWRFIGEIRAFSFFGSAMAFGLFCAFSGALGIALTRTMPIRATFLFIASGLACYTTLTRVCYLIFFGACVSSLVFTFGKKPSRGHWQPLLWFLLGISTILIGINSVTGADVNTLQDSGSLLARLDQWVYFSDLFLHSSPVHQMFGLGLVQSESLSSLYGMVIDNTVLALLLHIGVIGLVLFGALLTKIWMYLRCQATTTQQPFVIAVASLWATITCVGMFNIVFSAFGATFALAILCECRKEYGRGIGTRQQPEAMSKLIWAKDK